MKIRKAVIPAAGYGTRFLPMTKASPKEMLPVVDKPVIQYVVEEVVASGIKDIIIVTSSNKRAIEDHFDPNYALEKFLEENNKLEQLDEIRRISNLANFVYVSQKGPIGNGTPILNAAHIIGDQAFAYIWGDEFIYAQPPRLAQTIKIFEKYQEPCLSAVKIDDPKALARYGVAKIKTVEEGVHEILEIVEKPTPGTAPSNIALIGAYVLTPDIVDALKEVGTGKNNELWLIDGINKLKDKHKIYAVEIKNGRYYDAGDKLEYLKTNIEFGLKREDIGPGLKKFIKNLDL